MRIESGLNDISILSLTGYKPDVPIFLFAVGQQRPFQFSGKAAFAAFSVTGN